MKIEALHIGMRVRHPEYGVGEVKSIGGQMADVRFDDSTRTVSPEGAGLTVADTQVTLNNLELPLPQLIEHVVEATVKELGLEKAESFIAQLGARWHGGKVVLHPADPTLQTKELPLEVFFHKIVMMRNQLRVLEQKLNGHPQLSDGEKVELQQYITRCYGSMTTFNLLFKSKEEQFRSEG